MTDLQVLISTYGPRGLDSVAALPHPAMDGVEYLVSWQAHEDKPVPESLRNRKDFIIFREESLGLCNNRNALLSQASAPLVVISDDDLEYEEVHLRAVLRAFRENPDAHFLTFRYASERFPKPYPSHSFDLRKPPKGYFVTSMELALNLKKMREDGFGLPEFDPAFGINGTTFCCGEEDLLVYGMLKRGMSGRFIPEDICMNTDSTTSERIGATQPCIEAKGAVMRRIKPLSWPLRMITHALRSSKTKGSQHVAFLSYCRWWLNGVRKS